MILRVVLDDGSSPEIERAAEPHGFATWCMMICREGFTINGTTYVPGRRVRRVELMSKKEDEG